MTSAAEDGRTCRVGRSMLPYLTAPPTPPRLALSQRFWSWSVTVIALNGWNESDQKAIRDQLDRILKSGPFHQSRRRQRFLEYIVNETLAGRGERLKGYNVALEVFDRTETFDSNIDPIVRMEAARLRDRLREYYEADGRDDPVRIELPKGTYTPHIEFRQVASLPWPDRLDATTLDRPLNPSQVSVASQPRARTPFGVPSGLHNCCLACAACRFQRLEVVGSIHSII